MFTSLSSLPGLPRLLQLPLFCSLVPSNPSLIDQGHFASSCPNAQLSCHNTSAVADSCCFNYPGGQFLQTQFWDTNPAVGPKDSWTIHGLWPDHCDGGFDQYCDNGRKYTNISSILSSFDGGDKLLEYMNAYWLADRGSAETLWEHEWNKHGTCISTLDANCYTQESDSPFPTHRYILDYFNITVNLFKTLDTYTTLAKAGILPDTSQTWSLSQLQGPLSASHGAPVTLRCRSGQLDEIWYHFDTWGSVQTGRFVAAAPDGAKSNCPSKGIKYLPKNDPINPGPTSTATTATSSTAQPTSTAAPFAGKGHLNVYVNSAHHGCLIRSGQWYTSGSCATYTAKGDVVDPGHEQLFTLSSRLSLCAINEEDAFECSKTLPYQTIFSADGAQLLFRNESRFYAEKVPGRFEKIDVFASVDDEDEADAVEIEIRWSGLT